MFESKSGDKNIENSVNELLGKHGDKYASSINNYQKSGKEILNTVLKNRSQMEAMDYVNDWELREYPTDYVKTIIKRNKRS